MKTKLSLKERFIAFAKSRKDAECIDDLPLTVEQKINKKGDFFFRNRSVICEFKSLMKDTSPKVDTILAPLRTRPEWPLFYGEWKVSKILQHFPEGENIGKKIIQAATTAIANGVRDANRQIRQTKNSFCLPNAGGLLVLLNDAVDILSPHVIVDQIQGQLKKRKANGEPRFPAISVVWIINETHSTSLNPNLRAQPLIMVINDYIKRTKITEDLVEALFPQWALSEGMLLIDLKNASLKNISFDPNSSVQPSGQTMKRYEIWQREYRASPYLKNLEEKELLDYGEKVLRNLNRTFIHDSPKKPTMGKNELSVRWTHLLEEFKFRGLDMRKLRDRLRFEQSEGPEDLF